MQLNELIKNRRLEIGLTDKEAAKLTGLSIHEYADVEDDPREATTVLRLKDLRIICSALGLNMSALLKHAGICNTEISALSVEHLPLNVLIRRRREAVGLSTEGLADKLGFHDQAILDMETDPDYLEGWPLDLICHLCTELRIPLSVIIDSPNVQHT